jgi:hypothetical protein
VKTTNATLTDGSRGRKGAVHDHRLTLPVSAALSGVAIIGMLAACSTAPTGTVSLPTAAAATTVAAKAVPAKKAVPARPDGSASQPLPWGATYHDQSMDITLAAPVAYTPSESAFEQTATGRDVTVTVTLVNRSSAAITPETDLNIQGTSGTAAAGDVEDNSIGAPSSPVLPGHTIKWRQGLSVPKSATDLQLAVALGFGGTNLYYSGSL